jgi:hypothetical protein
MMASHGMTLLRTGILAALLAVLTANARAEAPAGDPAPSTSRLGMNLSGPADWNTEYPFVDVFRLARTWISQKKGAGWGKGPALELDAQGWIKRLEPDCWAETPLCTGGHAPKGEYVCLYEGDGKIGFNSIQRIVDEKPGRIVFETEGKGFFLKVAETNPEKPVRNIRVLLPGFETTYRDQPFHPVFFKRWAGFNTFRFMDWMETNGSKVAAWEDRPTPERFTWTERGIPLEVMADLCNRLKVNPWFCMPHRATDEFVRKFAEMTKAKLDPSLKVHVEYSNEVWNGMFEQARYAQKKAVELGIGPKERPWEGGCQYYAQRSLEIFAIWEQVFGGKDRLVRVLAWQAASGAYWTDGMLLSKGETAKRADALAIAPYVTMCIPAKSDKAGALNAEIVAGWSVDQLMDHVEQKALPECLKWIADQKKVADKYGLRLMAYEGGQHLVGVGGGENNEAMTKLFQSANRHPRMGAVYKAYLDGWKAAGGDLFCIFSSVGRWSKWGSWGLAEHYAEMEADQPKLKAVMEWNRGNPR